MRILEAKYSSERIADIDLLQLDNMIKVCMLRVHVITGWTIPLDEMMALFIDEFRRLLLQDYSDVNFDEIVFAFRKYKNLVQDWGKEMNLNLIGQVMEAYMEDRYDAGLLEERIKMDENVPLLEFKPKEYTEDDILAIALDYWQNSKSPKIEFINPACYEILVKSGKIKLSETDKELIRNRAKSMIADYFRNAIEFKKMSEDKNYISMLCKKISISEYFNTLKKDED